MASYEFCGSLSLEAYSLEQAFLAGSTVVARFGDQEWRFAGEEAGVYFMYVRNYSSPGRVAWAGVGSRASCAYAYFRSRNRAPSEDWEEDGGETPEELNAHREEEYRFLSGLLGREPALEIEVSEDKSILRSKDGDEISDATLQGSWERRDGYGRAPLPRYLEFIAPLFRRVEATA
jgi:hypothetical protein